MQAIVNQTTLDPAVLQTVDPVTLPTVTYNKGTMEITASVIVSWDSALGIIVQAPPIVIIGSGPVDEPSPWTVLWNLHYDDTTLSACFDSNSQGVEIPAPTSVMPLGVGIHASELGTDSGQWKIVIENGVQSASSFKYDIALNYCPPTPTGDVRVRRHVIHDPTIVVVPDPIDS